jgi:hypothetical protein
MNPAAARTSAPPPVVFRDAFGERRRIVAPTGGDTLDVLCLRGELTAVPSFEFALRERVSRLAGFRHPAFAQIRTVERLGDTARTLALISNAQIGMRISELLATAAKYEVVLDSDAALCLIRSLVTAMAAFHEAAPEAAHGALGPERVIVTPDARLVVVEHVMGSAIEQLQFTEDRYWRDLRVPCARSAGVPVIDQRADVLQIGMVALALLLRRTLSGDEFPSRVGDAVVSARAVSADGHVEALPSGLRPWLTSTLQLDPRSGFNSAIDAREQLETVFERNDDLGAPSALEAFLARYHERTERIAEPVATQPPVVPQAPVVPPVTIRQPVEPELVVSEPVAAQAAAVAVLPTPPKPILEKAPQSSEAWPEQRRATAQEPLRSEPMRPAPVDEQPVVYDPVIATPVPRAVPPEAPAAGAMLNRPVESARKPIPQRQAVQSHSSWPPATSHLDEKAEDNDKEPTDMPSKSRGGGMRAAVAALVLLALAGGGTMAARKYLGSAPVTTGNVVVTTNPPGAQILLDGKSQGVSPTTLTVAAGTHVIELRGAGEPRTLSVDVAAGAQLSQYIEMTKGPLAAGNLQVRTDPAGAKVTVDGVARGTSPVIVADLTPGDHTVVLESENGSTRQTVTVEAGATASLVANLAASQAAAASSGGWISVTAPKTVQLLENGHLLGSSDTERLMVPAGTHQLDIVNESLGYRTSKTVQVAAGKVSPIKIEFPQGTIALNAVPWADVWIDGERVGETPIGNLPLAVGTHEIVFRHPDLGEKHQTTTVTLSGPTRLSVDMRKKP